jgi:hypothetical protein
MNKLSSENEVLMNKWQTQQIVTQGQKKSLNQYKKLDLISKNAQKSVYAIQTPKDIRNSATSLQIKLALPQ